MRDVIIWCVVLLKIVRMCWICYGIGCAGRFSGVWMLLGFEVAKVIVWWGVRLSMYWLRGQVGVEGHVLIDFVE